MESLGVIRICLLLVKKGFSQGCQWRVFDLAKTTLVVKPVALQHSLVLEVGFLENDAKNIGAWSPIVL